MYEIVLHMADAELLRNVHLQQKKEKETIGKWLLNRSIALHTAVH